MQQQHQLSVPLSRLVPGKRNPRRVKPARESHKRLVALIRSQGLLQPLVVRPIADKPKHFLVVAGHRRLAALQEIHKGDGDPKIPCVLRDVDADTADALALGENFGQERMHPLDEAEAFAKLVTHDGKDAAAIASDFGTTEHYVKQRMKLASLAGVVKEAYRKGQIDTASAEAFASVPEEKQVSVWQELNGHPRHAEHVRQVIANDWIDAGHALFDVATLPGSAVSKDLFSERVLVERSAFMEAQTHGLEAQRQALIEEGWAEVVVGKREDVQDRLHAMDTPEREFDQATIRKLEKIDDRRKKLAAQFEKAQGVDDAKMARIQARFEELEDREHEIVAATPVRYSEATKAIATVFLLLDPDGQVHRHYRIPRQRHRASENGNGQTGRVGAKESVKPPTSDDLSDRQRAVTFTHQALAVREALLKNPAARRRVLALILHEEVRSEALSIRHEANGTTLEASMGNTFKSSIFDRLKEKRAKLDPFTDRHHVDDQEGYLRLGELPDSQVNALIDLLTVECVTAHMVHRTELVQHLSQELEVDVRKDWRPDAPWLSSFKKIQLAHLITELKGAVHAPAPERKKSELVEVLAKLFADAADGNLADKELAERVNRWLPANLRKEKTKNGG
jgi:ParB/RepB/Spo0J family partition protein